MRREDPRAPSRRHDRLLLTTLAAALLALTISVAMAYTTLHNRSDLLNQRDGRRLALSVVCASTSAVIESGREVLTGTGALPAPLAALFERYGYSERAARAAARLAAERYAREIAREVQRAAGRRDLVRKDGSLNCERLTKAAGAG